MGQFTISSFGKSYQTKGSSSSLGQPIFLPNIRMTFIKGNNFYYTPHTANGRVGASCQAGNLGAVRRRT
jgi:hypothetical protein